jgi:uncharacterized damage-inducible protein DinB
VFEYKALSGQSGSSVFWQMLQHLVNHASYHRGQVTTLLRQLGAALAKRPLECRWTRMQAELNHG